MKITSVDAYPILDSRGKPTVEAVVTLADGSIGRGVAPSGASTGQFEAHELRDGDPRRFRGQGVFRAVEHVRAVIGPKLMGLEASRQAEVDRTMMELDGTADKGRLGANAILAVSMAVASAAACAEGLELYESLGPGTGRVLPVPEIQIIGGGAHADWRLDVQDFMVVALGARGFFEALEMTYNVYAAVGDLLATSGQRCGVADEGGYWPSFETNEAALAVLTEGITAAGYTPGVEVAISLDIAASDLYDGASRRYRFALENRQFTTTEFVDHMVQWCAQYAIVSLEDPLADEDVDGWKLINEMLGARVQLVGDDLFTTNLARIRQGVEHSLANAVLIKLNQIGTVTETLAAIEATKTAGWAPIISARSGETEDAFISHLAVATNAGQLKVGSIARGERTAKWNEVLRIERHLGERAQFSVPSSAGRR